MLCCARGKGGIFETEMIDEELAQENPHKTIPVKVIAGTVRERY